VAAAFVDFPKNKCNFLHKNKLDIVLCYQLYHWLPRSLVHFLTGRRPTRSFSPGAVATIALWKSAPVQPRYWNSLTPVWTMALEYDIPNICDQNSSSVQFVCCVQSFMHCVLYCLLFSAVFRFRYFRDFFHHGVLCIRAHHAFDDCTSATSDGAIYLIASHEDVDAETAGPGSAGPCLLILLCSPRNCATWYFPLGFGFNFRYFQHDD